MKTSGEVHWDYFLVLESDLVEIFKFVEPSEDNYAAYGVQITKLYLSVSSEIDSVLKELAAFEDPKCAAATKKSPTMDDYRRMAHTNLQEELDLVGVMFLGSDIACEPWNDWWEGEEGNRAPSSHKHPTWWSDHNKVKHNRACNYDKANLKNLVEAFAGLFIVAACLLRRTCPDFLSRPTRIVDFQSTRFGRSSLGKVKGQTLELAGAPFFDSEMR